MHFARTLVSVFSEHKKRGQSPASGGDALLLPHFPSHDGVDRRVIRNRGAEELPPQRVSSTLVQLLINRQLGQIELENMLVLFQERDQALCAFRRKPPLGIEHGLNLRLPGEAKA